MIRLFRRAFATLCLVATSWTYAADGNLGIVLLHGKWDRPPTNVLALSRQLEDAGYKVATPLMPWSDTRGYDATYTQALEEIEAAARSLRSKGATKIVIAGLSFGANGAIAYAASGRQVDGIAALSPGHTPERGNFRKALEPSVAKARTMVDSGTGTDKAWFEDRNQGQSRTIRASAQAYLSYFDPEGMGNMQKSASTIPSTVPVFMAVGTAESMAQVAEESIFKKAPPHEKSRYLNVPADHIGLVNVIKPELVSWLESLSR